MSVVVGKSHEPSFPPLDDGASMQQGVLELSSWELRAGFGFIVPGLNDSNQSLGVYHKAISNGVRRWVAIALPLLSVCSGAIVFKMLKQLCLLCGEARVPKRTGCTREGCPGHNKPKGIKLAGGLIAFAFDKGKAPPGWEEPVEPWQVYALFKEAASLPSEANVAIRSRLEQAMLGLSPVGLVTKGWASSPDIKSAAIKPLLAACGAARLLQRELGLPWGAPSALAPPDRREELAAAYARVLAAVAPLHGYAVSNVQLFRGSQANAPKSLLRKNGEIAELYRNPVPNVARAVVVNHGSGKPGTIVISDVMAKDLSAPMVVTKENIEEARRRVRIGMTAHGGASGFIRGVVPAGAPNPGAVHSLDALDENKRIQVSMTLRYGDIVLRHLRSGDRVIVQRSPCIGFKNQMSVEVLVVPYSQIGGAVGVDVDILTPALMGDNDGDTIMIIAPFGHIRLMGNVHEGRTVVCVDQMFAASLHTLDHPGALDPADNSVRGPCLVQTQHAVNHLTRHPGPIPVEEARTMVMAANGDVASLGTPALLFPRVGYTGRQVVAAVLPRRVAWGGEDEQGKSLTGGRLDPDGTLVYGALTKAHLGPKGTLLAAIMATLPSQYNDVVGRLALLGSNYARDVLRLGLGDMMGEHGVLTETRRRMREVCEPGLAALHASKRARLAFPAAATAARENLVEAATGMADKMAQEHATPNARIYAGLPDAGLRPARQRERFKKDYSVPTDGLHGLKECTQAQDLGCTGAVLQQASIHGRVGDPLAAADMPQHASWAMLDPRAERANPSLVSNASLESNAVLLTSAFTTVGEDALQIPSARKRQRERANDTQRIGSEAKANTHVMRHLSYDFGVVRASGSIVATGGGLLSPLRIKVPWVTEPLEGQMVRWCGGVKRGTKEYRAGEKLARLVVALADQHRENRHWFVRGTEGDLRAPFDPRTAARHAVAARGRGDARRDPATRVKTLAAIEKAFELITGTLGGQVCMVLPLVAAFTPERIADAQLAGGTVTKTIGVLAQKILANLLPMNCSVGMNASPAITGRKMQDALDAATRRSAEGGVSDDKPDIAPLDARVLHETDIATRVTAVVRHPFLHAGNVAAAMTALTVGEVVRNSDIVRGSIELMCTGTWLLACAPWAGILADDAVQVARELSTNGRLANLASALPQLALLAVRQVLPADYEATMSGPMVIQLRKLDIEVPEGVPPLDMASATVLALGSCIAGSRHIYWAKGSTIERDSTTTALALRLRGPRRLVCMHEMFFALIPKAMNSPLALAGRAAGGEFAEALVGVLAEPWRDPGDGCCSPIGFLHCDDVEFVSKSLGMVPAGLLSHIEDKTASIQADDMDPLNVGVYALAMLHAEFQSDESEAVADDVRFAKTGLAALGTGVAPEKQIAAFAPPDRCIETAAMFGSGCHTLGTSMVDLRGETASLVPKAVAARLVEMVRDLPPLNACDLAPGAVTLPTRPPPRAKPPLRPPPQRVSEPNPREIAASFFAANARRFADFCSPRIVEMVKPERVYTFGMEEPKAMDMRDAYDPGAPAHAGVPAQDIPPPPPPDDLYDPGPAADGAANDYDPMDLPPPPPPPDDTLPPMPDLSSLLKDVNDVPWPRPLPEIHCLTPQECIAARVPEHDGSLGGMLAAAQVAAAAVQFSEPDGRTSLAHAMQDIQLLEWVEENMATRDNFEVEARLTTANRAGVDTRVTSHLGCVTNGSWKDGLLKSKTVTTPEGFKIEYVPPVFMQTSVDTNRERHRNIMHFAEKGRPRTMEHQIKVPHGVRDWRLAPWKDGLSPPLSELGVRLSVATEEPTPPPKGPARVHVVRKVTFASYGLRYSWKITHPDIPCEFRLHLTASAESDSMQRAEELFSLQATVNHVELEVTGSKLAGAAARVVPYLVLTLVGLIADPSKLDAVQV